MKKALSVLLTLLLLFGVCGVALTAAAQETEPVILSGTCGDNITWTIEDGVLTVSGQGALEPLTRISPDGEEEQYFPWNDAATLAAFASQDISCDAEAWMGYGTVFYINLLLGRIDLPAFYAYVRQLVQTLIIGDGITEIPAKAFDGNFLPDTVVLPASLQTTGSEALFLPLTTSIIFRNPTFDFAANPVRIWSLAGENTPATTQEAFDRHVDAFIAFLECTRGEELAYFAYEMERSAIMEARIAAIHNDPELSESEKEAALAEIEAQTDYSDEYIANGIAGINQAYGLSASSYAEISEIAYGLLNDFLGTSFTTYTQLYTFENDGKTRVNSAALNAALAPLQARQEAAEALNNVYEYYLLGAAAPAGATPVPWLTVYGIAGSSAETAAAKSGVGFVPLCPTDHTHSVIDKAQINPSCTAAGHTEGWYCEDCGVFLDGEIIAPLNHINAYQTAATEPTATAHGYTAGVYCPDCETWLSGHEVIHNQFGAREVVKEATVTEEGEIYIVCTVCGETGLYALEKLDPPEPNSNQTVADRIRQFAKSVVDWLLRLIRWIGKR